MKKNPLMLAVVINNKNRSLQVKKKKKTNKHLRNPRMLSRLVCLTLCDPMACSVLGFRVLHYLPKFAHTHVY